MFPANAKTAWLDSLIGFSDIGKPGSNPKLTPSERNVFTQFGSIKARGGMSKFGSIATPSGGEVIQLVSYRQTDGSHELLRIMPAAVERWTGSAWSDITGTALTGTTASKPVATHIDDTLVFTNGVDLPRKWDGTGTTLPIADSTSPYSKGAIGYLGFLFLFDISDDGSFSDVLDGHRTGRYSDDWDHDWNLCDGNEIILDETPGRWNSACVLGRTMFGVKSDGVVAVRFTPTKERFQQDLVPSDVGNISSQSLAVAGRSMAFFCGTDAVIYQLTQQGLKAVTYEQLHKTLPDTKSLERLQHCRGVVDSTNDRYILFYDRTGLTTQRLNSWVSYNYRTQEVDKGECIEVISTVEHQTSDQAPAKVLTANATLVHEFDSSSKDDDGATISKFWTSGYQPMAGEAGWLLGARIIAKKSRYGRIAISVATNLDSTFRWKQWFKLIGGNPDDEYCELEVKFPPQFVEWANLKLEFSQAASESKSVEITRIGLVVIQTKTASPILSPASAML